MNIEEFVNEYLQEHRHDVLLNPYNGLIDFANAFKNKMMEDAVEGEVCIPNVWVERKEGKELVVRAEISKELGLKFGDKVRVIVLKKED